MNIELFRKIFKWGGIFAFVITIIYGFYLFDFKSKAILTQGEIIDFKEVSGKHTKYYPIVKIFLSKNDSTIIELERTVEPAIWSKGEKVEVLYNSETNDGRMGGFFSYWQPIFIGLVLSVLFYFVGSFKKLWNLFGK